jgi:hypothetical protein
MPWTPSPPDDDRVPKSGKEYVIVVGGHWPGRFDLEPQACSWATANILSSAVFGGTETWLGRQLVSPCSAVFLGEPPVSLSWIADLYQEGEARASSAALVKMFRESGALMARHDFDTIGQIFRSLEVSKLAPEILIGLLRMTSRARDRISDWRKFFDQVRTDLQRRGFDVAAALRGLSA